MRQVRLVPPSRWALPRSPPARRRPFPARPRPRGLAAGFPVGAAAAHQARRPPRRCVRKEALVGVGGGGGWVPGAGLWHHPPGGGGSGRPRRPQTLILILPPFPVGKASRWFGVAQSKSAKTNVNILHQEELIAQKKREIEARLEQQARQNYLSIQQLPLFGEYVRIMGLLDGRFVGGKQAHVSNETEETSFAKLWSLGASTKNVEVDS